MTVRWRRGASIALTLGLLAGALAAPALADSDEHESKQKSSHRVETRETRESEIELEDENERVTASPSPSASPSVSPTVTGSPTPAPTQTQTVAPTQTATPTASPSPSVTPSPTPTAAPSPSPSPSPESIVRRTTIPPTSVERPTPWAPLGLIPVFEAPAVGRASVNGVQVAVVVRANAQRNGISFLAPGWQIALGAKSAEGATVQLTADGALRVERDHNFITSGSGFAANSPVDVYVHSVPIKLGTVTTNASGEFSGTFPVPDELADGTHTLQLMGYSPSGLVQEGQIPVTLYRQALIPITNPPVVKPPVVKPPVQTLPTEPGTFTKSSVIYFQSDKAVTLKRGKKALRGVVQLLTTLAKTNSKVTAVRLSVANTRKELRPSHNLAIKRLRTIYRVVRPRAGTVPVSREVSVMRRHNWAFVRITVTYQR